MTNFSQASPCELMQIYQKASPEDAMSAFNELYFRYSQKVYNYIIKKCQNRADAEDLLQKIFIKIHESKHLYKKEFKFEQWLFIIAKTQILDHFRSVTRYESKMEKLIEESKFTSLDIAVDEDFLSEFRLDDEQMKLLEFKYIDSLSYKEMSKLLNKPEANLRKTVSRLISKLRKEY